MKKIIMLICITLFTWEISKAESFEHLYVVGNACEAGWDTGRALEMTNAGSGIFTWTGTLSDHTGDNGHRGFKFLTQRDWGNSITVGDPGSDDVIITSGHPESLRVNVSGNDNRFQVPETAVYNIIIDLNEMTMVCTLEGAVETPDYDQLYLVGDATEAGWDSNQAIGLRRIAEGIFVWTGELSAGTFKFLNQAGTWDKTINPKNNDITFSLDTKYSLNYRPLESSPDDKKFTVNNSGKYTIVVSLKSMEIAIGNAITDFTELFLVGSALNENAVWDYVNVPMTNSSDGVFTWTGQLYAGSEGNSTEFKLRAGDSWDKTFCSATENVKITDGGEFTMNYRLLNSMANDFNFKVDQTGKYSITVDFNEMKMNVESVITGNQPTRNVLNYVVVLNKTISVKTDANQVLQSIAIYDITGKCLNSTSLINNSTIIAHDLACGVYLIKIKTNEQEYRQKIIIK